MVAAYAVIWFLLLVYVVVLGTRTARITRELELLARLDDRDRARGEGEPAPTAAPAGEAGE